MTVTEFKRPEYFEKIAENVSHLKVFIEFQFSDLVKFKTDRYIILFEYS